MRKGVVHNANGHFRKRVGSKRRDKRSFSSSAGVTHGLNLRANPMRGGYRL